MFKSVLALCFVVTAVSSHAATAWKAEEIKDSDGNIVCVYKNGFKKYYQSADFGTMCPLNIEVIND